MTFMSLAWDSLSSPLGLAVVVEVLMFFLFKPIISLKFETDWANKHGTDPTPNPWKARDLTLNIVTLALAWIVAGLRIWPTTGPLAGQVFVLGLQAGVMSIGGYEGIKNVLRAGGINISTFRYS